jgi:phosphoribosyl-AMP cyclohydrolase
MNSDDVPTDFLFSTRKSIEQIEHGTELAPKFDRDGLMPCVATDAKSGEVLMLGYMNREALRLTVTSGKAHYWSRSRKCLWLKGATSGLVQHVVEMRIDDDQDSVWLSVNVEGDGASCHVGYRSCFYRSVELRGSTGTPACLTFVEATQTFDPEAIYGDAPSPTQL